MYSRETLVPIHTFEWSWKRSHQWKKLVGRDGWLVVKMPIIDPQSYHENKAPTLQVSGWFSHWFVSVGGEGCLFNDSKQIRETRVIFGKQPKQPCEITSNDSSHGIIQWLKFTGQFWKNRLDESSETKKHRNQGFSWHFACGYNTFGAQYMAWFFGVEFRSIVGSNKCSTGLWLQSCLKYKRLRHVTASWNPPPKKMQKFFSQTETCFFLFKKIRDISSSYAPLEFWTMADLPERTTAPLKKQ